HYISGSYTQPALSCHCPSYIFYEPTSHPLYNLQSSVSHLSHTHHRETSLIPQSLQRPHCILTLSFWQHSPSVPLVLDLPSTTRALLITPPPIQQSTLGHRHTTTPTAAHIWTALIVHPQICPVIGHYNRSPEAIP